jgi:hypothetical protein
LPNIYLPSKSEEEMEMCVLRGVEKKNDVDRRR